MRAVSKGLSLVALMGTVFVGIYMAQPWGENDSYQSVSDYFVLILFLVWAISPYLYINQISNRASLAKPVQTATLVSAVIVCVGGLFLIIDTAFFNIDAQGALILIALPFYQWLLIGTFRGVATLWGRKHAT